ncbi:MAG: hypothetical protein U9N38_03430 [Thermodesulfobacteriota bacterium]|nr:hypothetical protein [Thermodesulfobacteriota bacterium]
MNKLILISTDQPFLYQRLNGDLPAGVNIISPPPIERRGLGAVNIDITLTIDLTKIASLAFAIWLCKRLMGSNRAIDANINRKQIPVDQSKAIDFVKKEVERE